MTLFAWLFSLVCIVAAGCYYGGLFPKVAKESSPPEVRSDSGPKIKHYVKNAPCPLCGERDILGIGHRTRVVTRSERSQHHDDLTGSTNRGKPILRRECRNCEHVWYEFAPGVKIEGTPAP